MLPIRKIVCPTDFSEASLEAVDAASELAVHFGAELFLVHALDGLPFNLSLATPEPSQTPAESKPANVPFDVSRHVAQAREAAEQAFRSKVKGRVDSQVHAHFLVREGDAAGEILGACQAVDADFIVMATQGMSGLAHAFTGSVAQGVLGVAKQPVLLVRAG